MIELGWFSLSLFLKGKLLRDPVYFARQTMIATALGTFLLVLLAQLPIPLCIPVGISSITTGVIMPFLLKDFRMK